jgi:CheY-like chemotaxis protein
MREGPHVVLGERDPERRRSIAVALREAGYEVVEADDGRDVLAYTEYLAAVKGRRGGEAAIASNSFAIVAGRTLPGLAGMEVQEILRRARWDIPVILLPEHADAGADLRRLRTLLRQAIPDAPLVH